MKHSDIAHYRQMNMLRRRFQSRLRRFPPALEPAAMEVDPEPGSSSLMDTASACSSPDQAGTMVRWAGQELPPPEVRPRSESDNFSIYSSSNYLHDQ